MHEDLLHRDHDGELGHPVLHGHGLQQRRVGDETRLAVDAQRVLKARHDEEQADVGVGQDVDQRVEPVVARPVGDGERAVVQHPHEADRVTARAHVGAAIAVLRADAQEGRTRDELAGVRAEVGQALLDGQVVRGLEVRAQRLRR